MVDAGSRIVMKNICKTFRVAKRDAGFGRAVKALFKKEYSYVEALKDISFTLKAGEMVGYIGPNGAGKSSTIKVMSGILTPDSGSCTIGGLTPWKNRKEHVRNIGVVFGQRSQLWWDVPVIDSFELIRDIYQVEDTVYKRNLDELVTLLDLSDIIRTPTRQLSLGQRMRCEIAASLLHEPQVLFLDEPTIGLDAVSKLAVREFIRRLNAEKKTTVILTTHDMQDIEALTQRILLIGKGRILLDGDLEELKRRYSRFKTIRLTYNGGSFAPLEGLEEEADEHGQAVFQVDTQLLSVSQAMGHLTRDAAVTDLAVEGISMDKVVVSLYEEYEI